MQEQHYFWHEGHDSEPRLLKSQSKGVFDSFLIWQGFWTPIPLLKGSDLGFKAAHSVAESDGALFDVETSVVIRVEDLRPVADVSELDGFDGWDSDRFPSGATEYLLAVEADRGKAQYIYGLGRANIGWDQERGLEHHSAIYALTSYVGAYGPDGEDLRDWEENLYPLTLLTDAWIVLGSMQFSMVEMLNWGFSEELALSMNEVIGILRAAAKYDDVDAGSAWAVVSAFLLGALAERADPDFYYSQMADLNQTLDLIDVPKDMRAIVAAHGVEQIYPGH